MKMNKEERKALIKKALIIFSITFVLLLSVSIGVLLIADDVISSKNNTAEQSHDYSESADTESYSFDATEEQTETADENQPEMTDEPSYATDDTSTGDETSSCADSETTIVSFDSYGDMIMTREYFENATISSTNSKAGWFVCGKYLMTSEEVHEKYGDFTLYFSHSFHHGETGFLYNHASDWFHFISNTGIHFTVYAEKDLMNPWSEWEITGYEVDPDCICDTVA